MKKNIFSKNGQGLVEVIIAMSIVMIVVSAVMLLAVTSKNAVYSAENTTKATALAQEGIEIIRSKRNIGCDFNSLTADTIGQENTSCHVIWSDMVGNSDTNNTNNTVKPISDFSGSNCSSPNQIDKYDGFTRKIYLYDLSTTTWTNDGDFNSTFDARSKYYNVKAVVSWTDELGPRNVEISTIMLKRWKD